MRDAFDPPEPKPDPQKEKRDKKEFSQWQNQFIEAITDKWFEFDHPEHGKVKGICMHAMFNGFTEIGNIPDFSLTVRGRSGKEMIISLVESNARQCEKP